MMPEIVSERLRLRPFRRDDVDAFVAYRSDVEVARYSEIAATSWRARFDAATEANTAAAALENLWPSEQAASALLGAPRERIHETIEEHNIRRRATRFRARRSPRYGSRMIDWGLGNYERTAAELEPVAEHVVTVADLQRGERLLDLATGTGNAALLAARAGAVVTGLDAAERLIAVARQRAADGGADIVFRVGDLQALPFEDHSFDVALSVFGLIFASDYETAFAEMMRVLTPGGRAIVSAWIPAGPIDAMVGVFARAMAAATGSAPTRFAWHDVDAVQALARRHRAEVRFHSGELRIEAQSPEAYLAAMETHPMGVAARPVLERAGTAEAATAQALAVLRQDNEDPAAFRVTSPYRLIEIHHSR